jgi:hypothetical protein
MALSLDINAYFDREQMDFLRSMAKQLSAPALQFILYSIQLQMMENTLDFIKYHLHLRLQGKQQVVFQLHSFYIL